MTGFYTRDGDDGYTGFLGEGRLPKYSLRTEAVGAIDEASAALGLARALCQSENTHAVILAVQRDLYGMMAEVSATSENAARFRVVDTDRTAWLENQTENLTQGIELPREFILPGDTLPGAALALARTTVRRAERWVARLTHEGELENLELLRYLNRLSSLCFVLELVENSLAGASKPTLAKQSKSSI